MELGSRFLRKIGLKKTTGASAPAAPAHDTASASGTAEYSTVYPVYRDLVDRYIEFNRKAKELKDSPARHEKEAEFGVLQREKNTLDVEFGKHKEDILDTSVSARRQRRMQRKKDQMKEEKQKADEFMSELEHKVPRDVAARKKLESYRGSQLVSLLSHVARLKETSHGAAPGAAAGGPSTTTAAGPAAAQSKRMKRVEEGVSTASETSQWLQFVSSIIGSIADGLESMKDLGKNVKESVDKLRVNRDNLANLKDNHKEASGQMAASTAVLSLISAIVAGIELGKSLVFMYKRRDKTDSREKRMEARAALANVCSLLGNLIGASSPFTALVPFLGTSLNIADSGLQIIVGSLSLASDIRHGKNSQEEKDRIWAEIQRKREKYKGTDSEAFFTIDGGKQNARKIDEKRKALREETKSSGDFQPRREKDARNKGEYRKAEMKVPHRIARLREKKPQKDATAAEKEKYKKKMHAMEALDLMAQYRSSEKAGKKMKKSAGHGIEGLITNAVKIVGNATALAGQITAASGFGAALIAAGTGINIGETAYETGRQAGSFIYKGIRKLGGAEKNKENTRSEMAAYLYDKMLTVAPTSKNSGYWDGGFFKIDGTADYKIREESKTMSELEAVLQKGLNAKISVLLQTRSTKQLRKAMAQAFSQDGGAEFAQDGI